LNSRIPHLEGKSIFGSAKRKLNLPPGDESDSHCYDHMIYTLLKIRRNMIQGQSRVRTSPLETTRVLSLNIAYAVVGLPIRESACSNTMAWKIEQINCAAKNQCRGHIANKRCTSRIAKYNWPTIVHTFSRIQQKTSSRGDGAKAVLVLSHRY
jgi:hypothetical protein